MLTQGFNFECTNWEFDIQRVNIISIISFCIAWGKGRESQQLPLESGSHKILLEWDWEKLIAVASILYSISEVPQETYVQYQKPLFYMIRFSNCSRLSQQVTPDCV